MKHRRPLTRSSGITILSAITLMTTACATAGGPAPGGPTEGVSADALRDGAFPMLRREGPELTSLPQLSTFAWVPPSVVLTGVSATEDELSMSDAFAERRDATSAVLRANGWRETTADSASFVLALIQAERTVTGQEMVPDPRNDMARPSVCAGLSREQRQLCREPAPRDYPPIARQTQARDSRLSFAIVRVHDQATRLWLVRDGQQNTIARGTVELLKAQAP